MKIYHKSTYGIDVSLILFCLLSITCLQNETRSLKEIESDQISDTENRTIICELDRLDSSPNRNFRIIYYDDSYLFTGRHYGNANHPLGNTTPAFFVHSKPLNKWLKIKQISTKRGKFGSTEKLTEEETQKMIQCATSIGQTHLAKLDYCELPLRTGSGVAFPKKIILDPRSDEYILEFFGSWNIEKVKTILRFRKEDLDFAFSKEYIK